MPPSVTNNDDEAKIPSTAFRILITGFGPFQNFEVNPSWLAVKPLHNTIITVDSLSRPVTVGGDGKPITLSRPIHVTALEIPVTYDAVLSIVPLLHAQPPVLPANETPLPAPPIDGYDFIFHVGVAPPGRLRAEMLGHKLGYDKRDAAGKLAPRTEGDPKPSYGFTTGYEEFPDVLTTDIDVDRLVHDLEQSGTPIYKSNDAGYYLCDFIYYCSLAESRRNRLSNGSPVLFLHCCPVRLPLSTEEVTEEIKRIALWVCNELSEAKV